MARREKKYEEKSLAEKQVDFSRHLRTYLVMSMFFFILNFTTGGAWWWYWPVLGWGIGVLLQGLSLYGPLRDPDHIHPPEQRDKLEPLPDLKDAPRPLEMREIETKPYREDDLV